MSSMSSRSISRSASLNGDRRVRAQRRHEAEHEVLGRQIDDVARRLRRACRPRDGVQKVRLAAPDAGVDVERIVGGRTAEHRFGDRLGRRERHPVGSTLAERLEGVARIDRRTAETAVGVDVDVGDAPHRRGRRLRRRAHRRQFVGLLVGGLGHLDARGAAHDQLDARHALVLRGPQRQQLVAVVRIDPRLEEARRHRQIHGAHVGLLEGHPPEPAREDVLTELGAQQVPDPQPLFFRRPFRHWPLQHLLACRRHLALLVQVPTRRLPLQGAGPSTCWSFSFLRKASPAARLPPYDWTHGNPSPFQLSRPPRCRSPSRRPSKPLATLKARP